jgi:hypothetical protein
MGDRTYVQLRVPMHLAEQAKEIMGSETPDDESSDGELARFNFSAVNYGELEFLSELRAAGIPYDSEWESGDEYGPGTEHCRFTSDGEIELKTVYDEEMGVSLHNLLPKLADHAALKKVILQHQKEVTPLDWDSQEYNRKIYLARQLISPIG